MSPFSQLTYLRADVEHIINGRHWRWYGIWFQRNFYAILTYRISRFCYLLFGRGWQVIHLLLRPLFFLVHPWFHGCEIHYKADIGPGLSILHPSLGIVISGKTIAGKNLLLVGGNCIGAIEGDCTIQIGDDVVLGAAANILGPVKIGNNVQIGMSALVIDDAPDDVTLVGVPAHIVQSKTHV